MSDDESDVEFVVEVDAPARSVNGGIESWPVQAARRTRERQAVLAAFADVEPPDWPHFYVVMMRVAPSKLDGHDNLASAMKAPVDALARWLRLDDADPRVTWGYAQRVERTRDTSMGAKRKFRSYIRIYLSSRPIVLGADDIEPAGEGRAVSPASRASKPVVPEPPGGDLVREVELPKRTRTSRLVASLRVVSKPSPRGKSLPAGSKYIRLSVYWESFGERLRSQGVAVRLEEVDALVVALRELHAAATLPPAPPGCVWSGSEWVAAP